MIERLRINRFRNYDTQEVEFGAGVNCLVGVNGQGKTNLLEAVYFLSLLRSFRTNDLNLLRQWNASAFLLRGTVREGDGCTTELFVSYGEERRLKVNETPVYRASDFINHLLCVTFIPEDLSLIQGSPALRRRFLNIAISQTDPAYFRHLQAYQDALQSRNLMLRQPGKYSRQTIAAYDAMLAREGAELEVARIVFVQSLREYLSQLSGRLLGDGQELSINYLSRLGQFMQDETQDVQALETKFRENLDRTLEYDMKRGSTSIGPHRSDFTCSLNKIRMDNFSSQGECRIASLALRLACLNRLQQMAGGERITILVDDVIGELDANRRASFFQTLQNAGQILFACTELPQFPYPVDRILTVSGGRVNGSLSYLAPRTR